jgi:dTDP-4-amino-4,6-dideoxygalactose transaminase
MITIPAIIIVLSSGFLSTLNVIQINNIIISIVDVDNTDVTTSKGVKSIGVLQ